MMNMSIFEKDFARMFPASSKAERIMTLENKLANEVLSGNYTNITRDALEERLTDTELFWDGLQALIVTYNTKPEAAKQKLDGLMGVISGLAFDVALDAAPTVDKRLIEQAKEDHAAEIYDRVAS
jgi:hypothetical protein